MKLLIAGDVCPRGRVSECFENGDYETPFGEVRSLTEKMDYSIVNFECPVVEHDAAPIRKQGPNLKCSRKGLEAIKWAGFDCVTLANNHFLDFGDTGVCDTLNAARDFNLDTVGGGMNAAEASQVLYKDINGVRLAIINCCEHEFSIASDNGAGSNPLDPVGQYYTIKEAKTKADFVLVIIHGGHEHFQLPSLRMVETYRYFIDLGADAVVNHHQHCYCGYETYRGKPIFYGLGNFCFDHPTNRSQKWTEGYAVELEIKEDNLSFIILPYQQCAANPIIHFLEQSSFNEKLSSLNDCIGDEEKLKSALIEYYEQCKKSIAASFSPFSGRYAYAAISRGYVPAFISKKHKLLMENVICCESHRDKLHYFLNRRIK